MAGPPGASCATGGLVLSTGLPICRGGTFSGEPGVQPPGSFSVRGNAAGVSVSGARHRESVVDATGTRCRVSPHRMDLSQASIGTTSPIEKPRPKPGLLLRASMRPGRWLRGRHRDSETVLHVLAVDIRSPDGNRGRALADSDRCQDSVDRPVRWRL